MRLKSRELLRLLLSSGAIIMTSSKSSSLVTLKGLILILPKINVTLELECNALPGSPQPHLSDYKAH